MISKDKNDVTVVKANTNASEEDKKGNIICQNLI
jgi:hypothetical protein